MSTSSEHSSFLSTFRGLLPARLSLDHRYEQLRTGEDEVAMSIAPAPASLSGDDTTNKDVIETIENAPRVSGARHGNHKLDAAAELLRKVGGDASDRIVVTPADDKRVLRRIDTVCLSLACSLITHLQSIDMCRHYYP